MENLARTIVFVAGLIGLLLAIGVGANWLFFWYRRRHAERCALLAASRLGLSPCQDADPGVPRWEGTPVGQRVIVAAHAWGSLDAPGARFTFYGTPMVAIAAPFAPPLPAAFILSTARGAVQSITTGDAEFDSHFRLDSRAVSKTLEMFADEDLRRSVFRLLGPSTFWSGSGRVVEISHYGVLVRETIPRTRTTPVLAADVLAAALAFHARAAFLPPPSPRLRGTSEIRS